MWDVKSGGPGKRERYWIGFTLTMWDVKNVLDVQSCSGLEFYLNYVGCKDELPAFIKFYPCCFTLTMWDVKLFRIEFELHKH